MTGTTQTQAVRWAALFGVAACVALAVDVPVAQWFRDGWALGDVRKMLNLSEVFAHGFGVLMILAAVAVLDPWNRPRLLRVAVCAFGAGAIVQLTKHSPHSSQRVRSSGGCLQFVCSLGCRGPVPGR